MLDILYTLFIFPIETLIDVLYLIYFEIFSDYAVSILFLSITVNIIALPLYNIAEKWQKEERDIQKKLRPKLDDIKAVFRGNERHMIIKTYYRQNNYHPIFSLKGGFGLLIQIPFFIAAYHYLGHLEILKGQSYGLIKDLSLPDGMLSFFGGRSINILPVLMTVVNICSVSVYSKKLCLREKTQLYCMAVLFLALLYDMPAALVLYWTINNIFSFFKNLINSSENPGRNFKFTALVFLSLLSLLGFLCSFKSFMLFARITGIISADIKANALFIDSSILFIACLIIIRYGQAIDRYIQKTFGSIRDDKKFGNKIFFLSCFTLFMASGITAVSFLIESSPQEFAVNGASTVNPVGFINKSALQAFAVFVVYPCVIYFLFSTKVKLYMAVACGMAAFISIIDLIIFPGDNGIIYPRLIFENMSYLFPSLISGLANGAAIIALIAVFIFLVRSKYKKTLIYSLSVIITSLAAVSLCNAIAIDKDYKKLLAILEKQGTGKAQLNAEWRPLYNLSKKGKNVFIIMLDRASGGYIEEMMKSNPEIFEKMSGFIWYKNTVSYNGHTTMGMPAVFGGYEYTPLETNKRETVPLVKKHNESLLVLPRIFSDSGYKVTFTDPAFANFSRVPDLRIFDGYKNIDAENIIGRYTQKWINDRLPNIEMPQEDLNKDIMGRYLIKFGVFRIIPNFARYAFYHHGTWLSAKSDMFRRKKNRDIGDIERLIDNYSVLDYLPELTLLNSESDTLTIMVNEIIHFSAVLKPPDYIPGAESSSDITYTRFLIDSRSLSHFYTQAGALSQICGWLSYLRENNVYNNTKIIIVSDHGHKVSNPLFRHFAKRWDDTYEYSWYQPLLLVKDFNSNSKFSVSDEFMTNADTPAIAVKHLGKVKNPFTGNIINSDLKEKGAFVVRSHNYRVAKQGKYKYFYDDTDVVNVKDNIFVKRNWVKVKK